MKKRRLNTLVILIIAAVVIFGAYLIISNGKGNAGETTVNGSDTDITGTGSDESTESHKSEIFDFYTSDIDRISLNAKGQTIVIDRVTGTTTDESSSESDYSYYELIEPSGYILDQTAADTFAATIAYIPETHDIGNVDDLSQYGLKDPEYSLSVTLVSGEELDLNIGDKIIGEDGYYVNEPGSRDVRIINNYKAEAIMIDLRKIISKQIFTMKIEDVTEFMIQRKGEDRIVARKKTDAEMKDIRLGFETFKILEPLICDANSSNITTNIQALLDSSVNEYIEFEATDLARYGLDDPDYMVGLTDAGGSAITLEIGRSTDDNTARFVKFKDMDAVFTMTNDSLSLIDMPLEELVSSFIYIVNITNVDGIYLKAVGYELDCTIDHVKNEDGVTDEKFYVNGKDANAVDDNDRSYFRNFYSSILSVSTNTYEPDAHPAYDPEISVTFRFKGYADILVEYVRKDDYFYYAFINQGYTGILVRNTMFTGETGIYTTIPILLENLT